MYEARWYLCDLADGFERPEEPDWSRVPEAKREMVRERWNASQVAPVVRTYLWGPQIEWFARQPQHSVTVLDA